ncbi:hypothetical protein AVEN_27363-1 [Araneus ventricosus]|uniref:Uncharacterized protein n=1 Tax=Araneus ventricosus TaxID=182803 RepID=A0A4Y2IPC7_ARAVE|nr:hypothetical protein AVEN_27363-1 [Araneus ventricosus]
MEGQASSAGHMLGRGFLQGEAMERPQRPRGTHDLATNLAIILATWRQDLATGDNRLFSKMQPFLDILFRGRDLDFHENSCDVTA